VWSGPVVGTPKRVARRGEQGSHRVDHADPRPRVARSGHHRGVEHRQVEVGDGRQSESPGLHVTLVQNPLAVALLGDHSGLRGARASFVHRWFTDPDARQLYPEADHELQSRAFVADLRAAAARRGAKDSEAGSMISSLLDTSPEFAALWADHDVAFRRDDRRRLNHPALGLIEVNCLNLFSEDGRQRLLWFTPAVGTDSAGLLDLLSVLGTQEVTGSTG
jgi:hypothetical protein